MNRRVNHLEHLFQPALKGAAPALREAQAGGLEQLRLQRCPLTPFAVPPKTGFWPDPQRVP